MYILFRFVCEFAVYSTHRQHLRRYNYYDIKPKINIQHVTVNRRVSHNKYSVFFRSLHFSFVDSVPKSEKNEKKAFTTVERFIRLKSISNEIIRLIIIFTHSHGMASSSILEPQDQLTRKRYLTRCIW